MGDQVSDREREHMARLGRYIDAANEADLEAHLALTPHERLLESIGLMQWGRGCDDHIVDDDDPTAFYDRARALGMYEP